MHQVFRFLLLLCAAGAAVSVAVADHRPPGEPILQGVEYADHKDTAAIQIMFTDEVEYVSVAPRRIASIYTIRFKFRQSSAGKPDAKSSSNKPPKGESAFHPKEVLKPPVSPAIPLGNVVFTEDSLGPKLLLSFSKYVRIEVLPGPGANALTIKLPEIAAGVERSLPKSKRKREAPLPLVAPAVAPIVAPPVAPKDAPTVEPAVVPKSDLPTKQVTESEADKLMRLGKDALTRGENDKAIQIFTKLMGFEGSEQQRDALEFLGVARERNDQVAHAKSIYSQYIKQYPKGESTDRVRQRLADLISHQMKPKKKLKQADESTLVKSYTSQTFGSLSQYYYYGSNDIKGTNKHLDQSLLISQLSTSWRVRTTNYDIRNFLYGNHDYDFLDDENGDFILSQFYSDIKNSKAGFYAKLGRQSGSSGGVLGRFDGVLLGYDLLRQMRVNVVWGYPVEFQNKSSISTDKPFWGLNFEFSDVITNLDLAPYYIHQDVNGITDREAAGYELRYFHASKGNFFNLVDYDIYFKALNILLLRGQYNITDRSNVNFNFDYRRTPLLQSSTATQSGAANGATVEDLLQTLNAEEIRDLALKWTGESTATTLGVSHQASERVQFNADLTQSEQTSKTLNVDQITVDDSKDKQHYVSTQMIFNRLLNDRDTYVFGLRWSDTANYDNYLLSVAVRLPVQAWRWDLTYRIDTREEKDGPTLTRNRPTVKLDYKVGKDMELQFQVGMEMWRYAKGNTKSDPTATSPPDVSDENHNRYNANVGYHWNF